MSLSLKGVLNGHYKLNVRGSPVMDYMYHHIQKKNCRNPVEVAVVSNKNFILHVT